MAPLVASLLIVLIVLSDRIGPENVVLAMYISLSWLLSKLILRQGTLTIHKKKGSEKTPLKICKYFYAAPGEPKTARGSEKPKA